MRICILSVIHEPFDKRVYHKVGLSLAAAGHEIVSICPPPAQGEMPPLQDGRDYHGIRFILTKKAGSLPMRFLATLRLIRLGRRQRADLYLAPEPESWAAAVGGRKPRQRTSLWGGGISSALDGAYDSHIVVVAITAREA